MNIIEEMAEMRGRVPGQTRAQLIEGARYSMTLPDTSKQYKADVGALLAEIDDGKRRLDVAIHYAARLLLQRGTQQERTMENQHQKITGYRDLTTQEIAVMNRIKELGAEVGMLIQCLDNMPKAMEQPEGVAGLEAASLANDLYQVRGQAGVDRRWLSIARTDLQKGFMALTRSVAQPTTF